MESPYPCPECGGKLTIDPACVISTPYFPIYPIRGQELPRFERTAPAALCTGCEFAIEIVAD